MILEGLSGAIMSLGIVMPAALVVAQVLLSLAAIMLALLAGALARLMIRGLVGKVVARTKFDWDDILYKKKVFGRLAPLASWIVLALLSSLIFPLDTPFGAFLERTFGGIIIGLIILMVGHILDGANAIYETKPISKERPIKGYVQLVHIFLYIVAGIVLITAMLDVSPVAILSGFGAMSAVLLLVFKDTLLGLVSGVQISVNDMVKIGDWIEMPKYGADGDVIDISLQMVKVQNWDKTITTIPIYALISDSFKNWRGMTESGGRRIKRSINIDVSSVSFLSEEQIQAFLQMDVLARYMTEKLDSIQQLPGSASEKDLSRRRLTNIGTFRAYIDRYLKQHQGVNQKMTIMVRQLQPGAEGIPLEIYCFTASTRWVEYEGIQADIFDHLYAIVPSFGLRIYQQPSGRDIALAAGSLIRPQV